MARGGDAAGGPLRPGWGLAGRALVLQLVLVAVVVAVCGVAGVVALQRAASEAARTLVLSQARALAADPEVRRAVASPDPARLLQPLAEDVRVASGTSFVVVMSPDGTRYSHPDPEQVGRQFRGTTEPAVAGGEVVETFTGTLGPSVRAVVPVRADGPGPDAGEVVALVAVGVPVTSVGESVREALPTLLLGTAVAVLLAVASSLLLARRLRRLTFGLGARELARLYRHHDAVLHAIREGVVVVDADARPVLVNDEARRLLDLPGDGAGADAGAEGGDLRPPRVGGAPVRLPEQVLDLLRAPLVEPDTLVVVGERLVVVNRERTDGAGGEPGWVLTLRDRTELTALTDELGATRSLADAMHAQVHEASNRLHTVVALVELGDTEEALRLATEQSDLATGTVGALTGSLASPALVALLVGKTAQARERGCVLVVDPDTHLGPDTAAAVPASDLVVVVGNLVDNALEAMAGGPAPREVRVLVDDLGGGVDGAGRLLVRVRDTGPGFTEEALQASTRRGWSTRPAGGRGFGRGVGMALVRQAAARHGGSLDVRNDGGGCVDVTFPLPAVDGRAAAGAPSSGVAG